MFLCMIIHCGRIAQSVAHLSLDLAARVRIRLMAKYFFPIEKYLKIGLKIRSYYPTNTLVLQNLKVTYSFRNFQSVCESLNSFVSRKIVKFSYWLIVWNRISRLITKFVVTTQCGNYRNSLSHIFGKKFVKVTVLLNELLKSWFDESWGNFSFFHSVWL